MYSRLVLVLACAFTWLSVSAQNDSICHDYVIVSVRGTYELQGPSIGFKNMIKLTLATMKNGIEHDIVYPASPQFATSTIAGATAVTKYINDGIASCPNQTYAILGYSQGAAATIIGTAKFTPDTAAYDAIKGILVIGNPGHKPFQATNVDENGGLLTDGYFGSAYDGGVRFPDFWYQSTKLLDICHTGDSVCAPDYVNSSFNQHLMYGSSIGVQTRGTVFLRSQLTPISVGL